MAAKREAVKPMKPVQVWAVVVNGRIARAFMKSQRAWAEANAIMERGRVILVEIREVKPKMRAKK